MIFPRGSETGKNVPRSFMVYSGARMPQDIDFLCDCICMINDRCVLPLGNPVKSGKCRRESGVIETIIHLLLQSDINWYLCG